MASARVPCAMVVSGKQEAHSNLRSPGLESLRSQPKLPSIAAASCLQTKPRGSTVSLLLHSVDQSKSQGQPRIRGARPRLLPERASGSLWKRVCSWEGSMQPCCRYPLRRLASGTVHIVTSSLPLKCNEGRDLCVSSMPCPPCSDQSVAHSLISQKRCLGGQSASAQS